MIKGIAREISIVDINGDLAEGQALDLSHGTPYVQPVKIRGGSDYSLTKNSNVIVITAGRAQAPGETRLQLLTSNAKIISSIVESCLEYSGNPVILMVSNPVDVLTWVAWKKSGLPREQVIGSGTTMDTARLRQNIADHCKLDPRSVHAYIIGEHGDSEIASWSTANVGGVPIKEFCNGCSAKGCERDKVFERIFENTRNAAYKNH